MHGAGSLARLVLGALLLSAASARADQPPAEPVPSGETDSLEAAPAEPATKPATKPDDAEDPTWFGMGFESRQERFRRDLGMPAGPAGGAGAEAGGGGKGGGR